MPRKKRTPTTIHEQIAAVEKLGFTELAQMAGFGHAVLSLVTSQGLAVRQRASRAKPKAQQELPGTNGTVAPPPPVDEFEGLP